jgi:2-methylisocitrate lyase-like PEP mutase family enzyme
MTAAVSVPVSIDLEAGYGDTPDAAAESVTKILKAGAIGIKIEDGLLCGKRQLVSPDQHAAKIKAVRNAAQKLEQPGTRYLKVKPPSADDDGRKRPA